MKTNITAAAGGLLVAITLGCGGPSATVDVPTAAAMDGSHFLLTEEPAGVQDVIATRESAQHDQDVTVVGRIGGSKSPWIDGRAAFTIVDMSLKSCLECDDGCPVPWDYCCETHKLPTGTALVKFTDPNGTLIAADARELLQVKELETVIIQGKAKRDEAGNLTVIAKSMFVRR